MKSLHREAHSPIDLPIILNSSAVAYIQYNSLNT